MNLLISAFKKILKYKTLFLFVWCLICFAICVVYFTPITKDTHTVESSIQILPQPSHVLCLMVPYRERFEELLEFVPHMSKFLNRQSLKYHIVVINHLPDGYRFNKGSSFNAGFHIIRKKFPECDYIALHDVDTLPLADEVSYQHPGDFAYHGIPPGYHPIRVYVDPTYIGGILLMANEVFSRMNGFGNNFWGWGFEDIDFQGRMMKHSVPVIRPRKLSTDRNNSFKHIHGKNKPRDTFWCLNQAQAPYTRDRTDHTGLSDVNFTLASEYRLTIEDFPLYIFNINIQCNFEITPWCRPFCIDNVTMPKSIWDWDMDFSQFYTKEQLENAANLGLTADSPMWKRVIEHTSLSKKQT